MRRTKLTGAARRRNWVMVAHFTTAVLLASMCASTLIACTSAPAAQPPPPPVPAITDEVDQLLALVDGALDSGSLTRDDGYIYGVDVAQLALYAAYAGDRPLYERLVDGAARNLLVTRGDFEKGFVAWRYRDGTPPDATGTTEALRLARALWTGADRFARDSDRTLSQSIIAGYARHAQVDRGIWFIANYYNLGTNAFVTNSYLVDYDVDLVSSMGFTDLASRSRALVDTARSPSGLLYDLVQPEVLTLMPRLGSVAFSPNDVIQLANSCTVAEHAVTSAPALGMSVLAFTYERLPWLSLAYYGRDGEPATGDGAGVETLGCLLRLAYKLGDVDMQDRLRDQFATALGRWLETPQQPRMYTASEALLTAQCVLTDGDDC